MSHEALSGAQFRGVLHGVDEHGSKYSMPYAVDSQREVVEAARAVADRDPDVKWTEHSHEGSCDEAGCRF